MKNRSNVSVPRLSPLFLLALCLGLMGCSLAPAGPRGSLSSDVPSPEHPVDMDPKDFLDVPLNSKQRHRCSPAIPPDPRWRGVIIRGPRQVWFKPGESIGRMGAFAAIPICTYHLAEVNVGGPPAPMVLVAMNRRTGQVFSAPITETDPSPRMPPPIQGPPLTARQAQGLAAGGYFNPNLADFVPLPQESATYDIHLEFREFKSNIIPLELIEAPP